MPERQGASLYLCVSEFVFVYLCICVFVSVYLCICIQCLYPRAVQCQHDPLCLNEEEHNCHRALSCDTDTRNGNASWMEEEKGEIADIVK